MQASHLKSSAILSLINFTSRILGFLREMLKAYFFGTSAVGDAFQLAFSIPNLFRRLTAEGVLLTTFIPHFSNIKNKNNKKLELNFFYSLFWVLTIGLTIFCGLFIYYADWLVSNVYGSGFSGENMQLTISLTRIMFSYILFISIAALFQGLLNQHRIFILPAVTPIFLNLIIILFGFIFYWLNGQVAYGFSIGVLIGGIVQAALQLPAVIKLGFKVFKQKFIFSPYLSKMLKDTIPGIIGAGIYQIDIVVSNVIASHLAVGSVIALGFSNRLLELALGVFVISQTTVLMPSLADMFSKNKMEEASESIYSALSIMSFIILPIITGAILTSESLVRLLFGYGEFNERSILITSNVLICHLPGMLAIAWNRTLTTAYQAAKRFRLTMAIAFVVFISNASLALILTRYMDVAGIALASSISQFIQFFILIAFLNKAKIKLNWYSLFKNSLFKHIVAIIIMALAIIMVGKIGLNFYLRLVCQILIATIVYYLVNWILKTSELTTFKALIFRNKK